MKPAVWSRRFEASCRKWQAMLGLTDWTLHFKMEKGDGTKHANVQYTCDSRQVIVTSFIERGEADGTRATPERIALHEMLHIALADYCTAAARFASDTHDDVIREEHKVIERLLNALDGRP